MIGRMHCWHVAQLRCRRMFSVSCGSFMSSYHDCPPPLPADNSGSIEVPNIGSGTRTEDSEANLTGVVQFSGTACPTAVSAGEQVYFRDTQAGLW